MRPCTLDEIDFESFNHKWPFFMVQEFFGRYWIATHTHAYLGTDANATMSEQSSSKALTNGKLVILWLVL